MLAIADEHELYLLEFVDRRGLEREIERLRKRTGSIISTGESPIFEQLKSELNSYFSGKLSKFSIPLHLIGSDFQKSVWNELLKLPMGETTTYLELAFKIGAGTSYGAVGNANGANQIAIIIPCHRVINTNGELGGYGGGLVRKKWLLEHEENYALRA
jgi:AraC family transcriptional regulator of adaptative response/methylated-DNA-[protein]-cysteine methyltransferase